jgi:hypothetical protein
MPFSKLPNPMMSEGKFGNLFNQGGEVKKMCE